MAAQLDTLTCNGCGANLPYAAGMAALECAYCKATTPIPQAEREAAPVSGPESDDGTQLMIPLAVDQAALEQALLQHLASGRYTKDDLVARAVMTRAERFYAPAWSYSGSYVASWTASFGFDRSESYIDTVRRTENGQTRREPVARTRTVTDWRAVNGTDTGSFVQLGYGGSGLPKPAVELVEHSAGLRDIATYSPAAVRGVETQPFVVNQYDTYADRVDSRVAALIEAGVKGHAQGSEQRDWHWSADINKKVATVLVPVCHVEYEYKGRKYDLWFDGANPEKVKGDSLPTSWGRRTRQFMAWFVAIFATLGMLQWETSTDDWFWARLAGTAALWGHVWWRRRRIFQHSLHVRRQRLNARGSATSAPAAIKSGIDWLAAAATVASLTIFVVMFRNPPPKPIAPPGPVVTAPAPVPAVAPIAVLNGSAGEQAKGVQLAALMAAANADDWTRVGLLSAELKQAAPARRGDRAKSKAADARGIAALRRNDHAGAIKAFQAALRADASNQDARSNLGSALIASGAFGEAITVLSELLEAAPEHSKGWRQMAEAAALDGKSVDADASLRLLLHYAKDRKATIAALRKRAAAGTTDKFGEAVSRVLMLSS